MSTTATLERVVLISRHGERERLVKQHTHLVEEDAVDGGPALIPAGLAQAAKVGTALRKRYGTTSSLGDLGPHTVRAESSALARTLVTATVLLHSLTNSRGGPVPIFSRLEETDYILRGYAGGKCAALTERIAEWQRSAAFITKAEATAALRAEVGGALHAAGLGDGVEILQSGEVPLRDWWNAFDALTTAGRTLVPAATQLEATQLVAWVEAHKFGEAVGGPLCGGGLLAQILRRLRAPTGQGAGLAYFSAHYPTMLCLLGSIGISADDSAHDWLADKPFGTGSVLAFERHAPAAAGGPSSLQLWYLDANRLVANTSSVPDGRQHAEGGWWRVPLPCEVGDGEGVPAACLLSMDPSGSTFGQMTPLQQSSLLPNLSYFCSACRSTSAQMPGCPVLAADALGSLGQEGVAPNALVCGSSSFETVSLVLLPLFALTLVAAGAALCHLACHRRVPRPMVRSLPASPQPKGQPSAGGGAQC